MPIGMARMKSLHSGAVPRSTCSTSSAGSSTITRPISTSRSWVRKSTTARVTLMPVDSLAPKTLMPASRATTSAPTTMSPGEWRSGSQNSPPM